MGNNLKSVIPNTWKLVPFAEVVSVLPDGGKRVKKRDYLEAGKVPVIDQGQDYIGGFTDDESMTFTGELPVVLFGDHTKSVKFIKDPFAVGADGIKILKPSSSYNIKFFFYLLHSLQIPDRGYSRHFQFLKKFDLPLAPKNEQQRIVAEIEKQFSRLDEAIENLKRVKANLKRYKAAVLKAAVEGKLTEEWRKNNPDVEPADKLLNRILTERRKKWEQAELAKMKTNGKPPKDDKWKKKYKEPAKPETENLPDIPNTWVWASAAALADIQLGKMLDRQKHRKGHNLAYLRNINVRWGTVNTDDLLEMFFKDSELNRYSLESGDVLVCEGGEPGRAAVWDGRISDMKYQKALHRVRFHLGYEPQLLVFFLEFLSQIGRLGRWFTGSTIKHFTRESFANLPLPVPPVAEQEEIIFATEAHLSKIEILERDVNVSLSRADRLRQSILKKAFSGQLVL